MVWIWVFVFFHREKGEEVMVDVRGGLCGCERAVGLNRPGKRDDSRGCHQFSRWHCPAFVIRFLSVYLGTRVRNHLTYKYSRCVNLSIPLCAWMRMFCTKPFVMKWLAPCAWGPRLSLSCHRVCASWRHSLWIHGWVKVLSTFHYSPLLLSHTSCLTRGGGILSMTSTVGRETAFSVWKSVLSLHDCLEKGEIHLWMVFKADSVCNEYIFSGYISTQYASLCSPNDSILH